MNGGGVDPIKLLGLPKIQLYVGHHEVVRTTVSYMYYCNLIYPGLFVTLVGLCGVMFRIFIDSIKYSLALNLVIC